MLGPSVDPAPDRRGAVKLFRRGKKANGDGAVDVKTADPDKGMAWLIKDLTRKTEGHFRDFVLEHLQRIHEPGGFEREKSEVSDFMDLGMSLSYLEALDEIQFSPGETMVLPEIRGLRGGKCDVVTRWTVRGIHARPLAGVEPTGEETTIEGVTITTVRDYRLRSDYSYWQIPELTRKFVGP